LPGPTRGSRAWDPVVAAAKSTRTFGLVVLLQPIRSASVQKNTKTRRTGE